MIIKGIIYLRIEINLEGNIDGEINRSVQNISRFCDFMKGIFWKISQTPQNFRLRSVLNVET
jgi:hypothetical protein